VGHTILLGIVGILALALGAVMLVRRFKRLTREDWATYPRYRADAGGLFGAPPTLRCRDTNCGAKTYELFYGHCKMCAKKKGIPINVAPPENFHRALERGTTVVTDDE